MKRAQKYGAGVTTTGEGSTKGVFDYEKIQKSVNETEETYDNEVLGMPVAIKCKCVLLYALSQGFSLL